MRARLLLLLLGGPVAGLVGCDGPCRQLADRICGCETYVIERSACLQEVDSNGNVRQPSPEEDDRCVDLLDTCTCDALEREDFAACGLAQ